MPSPRAVVTQAEVRRYLRAMREAGFDEGRLEIAKPDGTKVKIIAVKTSETAAEADDFDDLIGRLPDAST